MISIHIMRMRRICHRPLEVLLEAVGAERERDIQNAVTPNPTLLNPEFAAVDGWNLTGDVTLGGGAAVLRESARTFVTSGSGLTIYIGRQSAHEM